MPSYFFPFIILVLLIDSYMLGFSANVSVYLQEKCLNLTAGDQIINQMQQSLICGEQNLGAQFLTDVRKLGIVHWFVVSGAHLIFMEGMIHLCLAFLEKKFSRFSKLFLAITILCLYFYALTSGYKAPIFRAFISFLIVRCPLGGILPLPPVLSSLLCGFTVLILRPEFASSMSFYLSWTAAFIITLSSQLRPHSSLATHAMVYIGLFPLVGVLGLPHPISVFVNYGLMTLFAHFLFPLTILSFLVPWLMPLANDIWLLFISFIGAVGQGFQALSPIGRFYPWISFVTLVFVHSLAYYFLVLRQRLRLCRP